MKTKTAPLYGSSCNGMTYGNDVGCGAGVTMRALVEAGFDTPAIDASPYSR